MNSKDLPKVSFVTPTLNEESRLSGCLRSIKDQDYPKDKIEIVIADGGSKDRTVEIAKSFGAKVFDNPLKTSESGKAVGVDNASGDIICLIDADNLLPERNWVRKMVRPLVKNEELVGSEALYYTHRPGDGFIDRYCALMGMNDPLNLWFGTYDRMNYLTGKWTGLDVDYEWKEGYLEARLEQGKIPTIGANGCMIRREVFTNNPDLYDDYLFDVDILEKLAEREGVLKFAKVDVGIIHLYCGSDLGKFAKKQFRRVKDYLYRRRFSQILSGDHGERVYTYAANGSLGIYEPLLRFSLSTVLVFPLLFQSLKGYFKKRDSAWFGHILLCWITLLVYARGVLESFIKSEELSRDDW